MKLTEVLRAKARFRDMAELLSLVDARGLSRKERQELQKMKDCIGDGAVLAEFALEKVQGTKRGRKRRR